MKHNNFSLDNIIGAFLFLKYRRSRITHRCVHRIHKSRVNAFSLTFSYGYHMDKYSSPISYIWGALCALFGALSLNDIAMVIGIVLSIATFIINWIYRRREFLHKKKLREQFYEKYNKDCHRNNL